MNILPAISSSVEVTWVKTEMHSFKGESIPSENTNSDTARDHPLQKNPKQKSSHTVLVWRVQTCIYVGISFLWRGFLYRNRRLSFRIRKLSFRCPEKENVHDTWFYFPQTTYVLVRWYCVNLHTVLDHTVLYCPDPSYCYWNYLRNGIQLSEQNITGLHTELNGV